MLGPSVSLANFETWGRVGIQPIVVDVRNRRKADDFLVDGDRRGIHLANIVSPGFTAQISLAKYVVDKIQSEFMND